MDKDNPYLLTLTAENLFLLEAHTANLLQYITNHKDLNIEDIAYTLNFTMQHHSFRRAILCKDIDDVVATLSKNKLEKIFDFVHSPEKLSNIYFFSGAGNHYQKMGMDLFERESAYKNQFLECADKIKKITGIDIVNHLLGENQDWIYDITLSQLIILATEYSMAHLCRTFGISPDYIVAYCFGELAAAVFLDLVTFDDAVYFLYSLKEIIETLPLGELLVVHIDESSSIEEYLNQDISIVAYFPGNTYLLAGPSNTVNFLIQTFSQIGIFCKKMNFPYMFHSEAMKEIRGPLTEASKKICRLQSSAFNQHKTYFSCSLGREVDKEVINNPIYWANIYCSSLDLRGLPKLMSDKYSQANVIELGPGRTARAIFGYDESGRQKFNTLHMLQESQGISACDSFYFMLAKCWGTGAHINWDMFFHLEKDHNSKNVDLLENLEIDKDHSLINEAFLSCKKNVVDLNEKEQTIYTIFSKLLKVVNFGVDDSFFSLGGDSILALQCVANMNQLDLGISLETFSKYPTVKLLARACSPVVARAEKIENIIEIPLLPLQKRFFSKLRHWKEVRLISIMLQATTNLNVDLLGVATQILIDIHDGLRTRFSYHNQQWKQFALPMDTVAFDHIDLSFMDSPNGKQKATDNFIEEFKSKFDLEAGPLVRFVSIKFSERIHYLVILFHHLCIDGISLQILLRDLDAIYSNLLLNKNSFTLVPCCSLRTAANKFYELSQLDDFKKDLYFWKQQLDISNCFPTDFTNKTSHLDATTLGELHTDIDMQKVNPLIKANNEISIFDILVTGFVQALNDFTGSTDQFIDLRNHGRHISNDLDLSRTIGWFTTAYPIKLSLRGQTNVRKAIREIQLQLRAVPHNGVSYNLLKYITDDERINLELMEMGMPKIAFNYHGQIDKIFSGLKQFQLVSYPIGNNTGTKATRSHLINLDLYIMHNKLNIVWTFSTAFHKQQTIQALSEKYKEAINNIITFLLNKNH